MRASTAAVLLTSILAFTLSCGKSPDAPTPDEPVAPALTLVAGAGLTDTIGAAPAQGLVVQVTGTNGKPEAGVAVDFEVPPDLGGAGLAIYRLALSPDGTVFQPGTAVMTDALGRAVVRLRLGTLPGPALVTVTVPLHGLLDTARYTVSVGAAAGVSVLPKDTVLEINRAFTIKATAVDRAGNPRSDAVTFEAASSGVKVDAGGTVIGVSPGRTFVRAKVSVGARTVSDSCAVWVLGPVANARLVFEAYYQGPLQIGNLDGTGVKTILPYFAGGGAWSPGLDRIAFCSTGNLGVTDTLGNATMFTAATDGCWPQFSRDGQWIYYHGSGQIKRIHPDGTGVESLFAGEYVTVAPDGSRVAYGGVNGALMIGDLGTRTVVTVPGTTGQVLTPRWSPDGQMIAYLPGYGNGVRVVRPDGTVVRTFSATFDTGLGWSADSKSIVAAVGYPGRQLVLLDLASGSMRNLPLSGIYPNWTP